MISLDANTRNNKTKGDLSTIRGSGNVPAIIYGGKNDNEKISVSKKLLKSTMFYLKLKKIFQDVLQLI